MKNILARIKDLRKTKGKSQEEMASLLGIGRAAYSKIETGLNEISTKHLIKISDEFNVSIDWLLKGELINKNQEQGVYDFGKYQETFKLMTTDMLRDEELMHTIFEKYFSAKAKKSMKNAPDCESCRVKNAIP